METYFQQEIERVTGLAAGIPKDLTFALVADSHLDDWEEETIAHIRAVDEKVHFDFVVHLGDFMTGNLPRKWTARILRERTTAYLQATENGVFYPVQGNHDGFCEDTPEGVGCDRILDEDWYAATDFTEQYSGVSRKKEKPYYYVDYEELQVRVIILCSFSYRITPEGAYQKIYEMSREQLEWLGGEALAVGEEWAVMLFSHDGPLKYFDQDKLSEEPWGGTNRELFDTVLQARKERGFEVAGWFIGHWHGDLCQVVEDIPFVIVGSQTSYVPWLWPMPDTGRYEPRCLEDETRDLWDCVIWSRETKTLRLIRFGAGEDRQVTLERGGKPACGQS